MKTYSLTSPPQIPGIYALKNRNTGELYVGKSVNLQRRFTEWRSCFSSKLGVKSFRVLEAIKDSVGDWDFVILAELPGATTEQLAAYEDKALTRLGKDYPGQLLNVRMSPIMASRATGPSAAKTTITENGEPVAYRHAASAIGCSMKTLSKRLARWRENGVASVDIETLRQLSEQYRVVKP